MSVPRPKTSSKNIPNNPQNSPAIRGACQFFILNFLGKVPKNKISLIKMTATIAAIGPIKVKLGRTSLISKGICDKSNGGLTIFISEAKKFAEALKMIVLSGQWV